MTDIPHDKRFDWLKEMLQQPKSVLTADTKVVLVAIWEAIKKDRGFADRHYSTLAKATGLTVGGVRGCVARAEEKGFIRTTGKGGLVKDAEGKVHGLAKSFWISLPALANTGTQVTCAGQPDYVCPPVALPVLANAPTCAGQHTNRPSLEPSEGPFLEPRPANAGMAWEVKEGQTDIVAQMPLSSDLLPVPDFKMQLAWGDQWPKTAEKIATANSNGTDAWTDSRVRDECMAVLGYSSPSPDEDKAIWKTVSESLAGVAVDDDLRSRYRQGKLTTVDVATYLASNGFVPPTTNGGVKYAQAS